jgi:hypothetical protein
MKRSTPEAIGSSGEAERPRDDRKGGLAFGAPVESGGTHQRRLTGQIIILPGGLVLVDQRLKLTLGMVASGPIECRNGRD